MNELISTRLFSLLAESSQEVPKEEMQNAYGEFVGHIKTVSNSDDYANVFRMLNFTRIELTSIEPAFRYEQGKKCLAKSIPTKILIPD